MDNPPFLVVPGTPRKAYRHLNGGSTAPSMKEEGKARMVRNEMQSQLAEQMQKLKETGDGLESWDMMVIYYDILIFHNPRMVI
jgi:hypothetical protein